MSNPADSALAAYADIAVQVGVNLQPGQHLLLRADVRVAPLVREITRSAYQAGARYVHVFYDDESLTLARFQHAPRDSFGEFPDWRVRAQVELIDAGAALISVASGDPDLLVGQDQELISMVQQTAAHKSQPIGQRVSRPAVNWLVIAAPSPGWAVKVFPGLPADEAVAKLWEAILAACRTGEADPVDAWLQHTADLAARSGYLNAKRYAALRYRGPGTDLTLGLADGHRWVSGKMRAENGVEFVANLPTEEVFTAPHRARVDGVVRASKPLNLGGSLIDDFSLAFREGRVVDVRADTGEDVLRRLIATDESAARLGEVALVPESSPIARANRIFYNTLFDENAASHIALGRAYRFNIDGGVAMDNAQFAAAGGNESAIHVDFMIGSAEIDIDGLDADGNAEPLMRAGEWAFSA
ncbi:aminopeptidase [Oscillochloris sp. ZM17-4]|uniref:aminopeptidase n=1 Tax=Oscillochloris sp. ZM17-4 TaxID=2866714 RepID=UPI001C72CC67|nr:aminopeptidase [Oscillochloris sp. ZM17-4]MBX0329060.1 aminopeptidase [Oscillochloris sp. ZM17-4]